MRKLPPAAIVIGAAIAAPFVSSAAPSGALAGRAVAGAVIFLEHPGVARDPVVPKRPEVIHLAIRAGRVTPHIAAAPMGAHLSVELADSTVDDLAAYWGLSELAFRRPFVRTGDRFSFDLTRPGLLTFENEEQPGRFDYVYVAPTAHVTLAGEDGGFRLEGLPAGRQSVSAWNERDGLEEASVDVPSGGAATHDFFAGGKP